MNQKAFNDHVAKAESCLAHADVPGAVRAVVSALKATQEAKAPAEQADKPEKPKGK